ncbi:MAG: hypothetical protein ACK5L0_05315 [Candidatus Fimivivens sp.]
MKRAYTQNQLLEMGFPVGKYNFPTESGDFVGTLIMKKWSDSKGLICYFITKQEEKLKLCVWYKYDNKRSYRPTKSDIDISYVELGTKLYVKYIVTKKGKTRWEQAEILKS